jgi:hypothetical protein
MRLSGRGSPGISSSQEKITMRRRRLLALVIGSVALGVGAGPAMADEPLAGQAAGQLALNGQSAQSSANSTQIAPSNTNINVRVLSPGDNGSVSQGNSSIAESAAGNLNDTQQSVGQSQSGTGGSAIQEAGQAAANKQWAGSRADSVQVHPTNTNVSVRVLSPGDDGDVSQSNESKAKSVAFNANNLDQSTDQEQAGHGCKCGSTGVQAAGQEALSKQDAASSAQSKQVKPENKNLSVRVLSPGDDGAVEQRNESGAFSKAFNTNDTTQDIEQTQGGSRCGCYGATGVQAAGQKAANWQDAASSAESKQIYPSNESLGFRLGSHGGGGGLTQSNASFAASLAANKNELGQAITQTQGT